MINRKDPSLQTHNGAVYKTSRDRHTSAPYLRLKNNRRRQNVKYSFTVRKLGRRAKSGDPFGFFNIHCCQISQISKKLKGDPLGNFFSKILTMPKKTERGDPLGFSASMLSQNIKKLKGDPLAKTN